MRRRVIAAFAAASVVVAGGALAVLSLGHAHAAVTDHTPLTWNMQGGGAKWTDALAATATHDVIALQEAGAVTDRAVPTGRTWSRFNGSPVIEYTVQEGGSTRGRTVYVYHMQTDPSGNRVNLAMLTTTRADDVDDFPPSTHANGTSRGRQFFGVVLPDGSRWYTIHAGSNGPNRSNDAEDIVDSIAGFNPARQWAIMGDWNREPSLLAAGLPGGTHIVRPFTVTQDSLRELDYMVTNVQLPGWGARTAGFGGADHRPVEFGLNMRASADEDVLVFHPSRDANRCITAQANGAVDLAPCDSRPEQEFLYNTKTFTMTNNSRCLDVAANGAPVVTPCGQDLATTQSWFVKFADLGNTIESPSEASTLTCLEVDAAAGNQLRGKGCVDTASQLFDFTQIMTYEN